MLEYDATQVSCFDYFQGTVKQLISLSEIEGQPTVITVAGNFMVYGTDEGYMRVYDLTRR